MKEGRSSLRVCPVCEGEALARPAPGCLVVAPQEPTCALDVWIAPEQHVDAVRALDAERREAWLMGTHAVACRWRANAGCDDVHGMGYVGSARSDWPTHLALRLVGRLVIESQNPMRLFNRREQCRLLDHDARARALAPPAGEPPGPARWDLTEEARLHHCLSCAPPLIERREITATSTTRLFQHGSAVAEGMLVMSPVRHVERLVDLTSDEFHGLLSMLETATDLFRRQMDADGTYFSFNDGRGAGQETPHVHVHLWARRPREPTNPFADGLPKMMGRPTEQQTAMLRDSARAIAAAGIEET